MTTPTKTDSLADDGVAAEVRTMTILNSLDRLYARLVNPETGMAERSSCRHKVAYTLNWLTQNLDLKELTDFIESTNLTYKTDILDLLRSNIDK